MLISIDVPHDKIQGAFIACFEGGYSPWLETGRSIGAHRNHAMKPDLVHSDAPQTPGLVWWGAPGMFAGQFEFQVHFDREEDPEGSRFGQRRIDAAAVKAGLEAMATKYPKHFAALITDRGDAITGDVFVQCVIFGKLIYG